MQFSWGKRQKPWLHVQGRRGWRDVCLHCEASPPSAPILDAGPIWLSRLPTAASGDERWTVCPGSYEVQWASRHPPPPQRLLSLFGSSRNSCALRDKHITRSANRDMDPLQTRRCRFLSFTIKDYNNKENWLKKTGLNTEGFLSWQLDRSGVCSEMSLILHPAKLWQTAFSNIERVKWQQLWEPEALALGCLQF